MAELGTFLLALIVPLGVTLMAIPALRRLPAPLCSRVQKAAAWVLLAAAGAAFGLLVACFILSDFSVETVADHSYRAKPLLYKISGAWGNHEGSMLLWLLVLTLYTAAFASITPVARRYYRITLATQGGIITLIALFTLLTSNPFARLFPPPQDGRGLNPILQDMALSIHPPALYLGYVGFSLVFSLGVAALAGGKFDRDDALSMRQWALLAWGCLTAGIGLGSWWAYRELGWGGWWFWDPVENASLLPWLSGTALLHTLALVEKRKLYPKWTIFLALLTFTLSLTGTFLVRSGVLTSVHAFANDPERGVFILGILGLLAGTGFFLLAVRSITARKAAPYQSFSRENMLMIESLLLAGACTTVLLGTIYPLAMQMLNLRAVSVGYPYYNAMFLPLAVAAMLGAALAPAMKWQTDTARRVLGQVWASLFGAALLCLVLLWLPVMRTAATQALTFAALLLIFASGAEAWQKRKLLPRPLLHSRSLCVHLGHLGLAVLVLGIVGSVYGKHEKELTMRPGNTAVFAGYTVNYSRTDMMQGPDYRALTPVLEIFRNEDFIATLKPQARRYPVQAVTTFESAHHLDWLGELTLVAGDNDPQGNFGIRLYYQPLIYFVWLGFGLLSLSGILGALGSFKHKSA